MSAAKFLATVAFTAVSAAANAQSSDCANERTATPTATDKAAQIGGNVLSGLLGGAVRDATRGLSGQAGKAVRDASGDAARYTGDLQRQARNSVNQATRAAEKSARQGAKEGVNAAKGAFEDCNTTAPTQNSAPQHSPAESSPAQNNAAPTPQQSAQDARRQQQMNRAIGNAVGGFLRGLN